MTLLDELSRLERDRFLERLEATGLTADIVREILADLAIDVRRAAQRSWQPEPIRVISTRDVFSNRLANVFEKYDIRWLHQLISMTEEEVRHLDGIGPGAIAKIRFEFGKLQWKFREETNDKK